MWPVSCGRATAAGKFSDVRRGTSYSCGIMSAWSRPARAAALAACALSLVVACGNNNSSKALPGAGGDAELGGAGNQGQGGSPEEGPRGGRNGAGADSGPTGTSSSIWKQTKSEILAFDSANGGLPTQGQVKIPDVYPVWETDAEAEIYTTFKDDQLWLYAFVQGSESYYLVKTAAPAAGDDVRTYQLASMSGIFTLEDGVLTRVSTHLNGTLLASVSTTYEPYTDTFPPDGWPSEEVVLDLTAGGAP